MIRWGFRQEQPSYVPQPLNSLHCSESRKTQVLMENFHRSEANLSEQVELKDKRSRRVLLGDIPQYMISIFFALKLSQELAIFMLHHCFHDRNRAFDQIENPHRAPGRKAR